MSTILLADVKARLNKTVTVDDTEIQSMIDAAEAEYAEYVGPISGTVTEKLDGGGTALILASPHASAITEAAYTDGTAISVDDLDLNTQTGIVYWNYGTAGRFAYGCRNVTVTYTIGTLPANHRKVIVEEVASWFRLTQRGNDSRFVNDEYDTAPLGASPLTIFPRIRGLAQPVVA